MPNLRTKNISNSQNINFRAVSELSYQNDNKKEKKRY